MAIIHPSRFPLVLEMEIMKLTWSNRSLLLKERMKKFNLDKKRKDLIVEFATRLSSTLKSESPNGQKIQTGVVDFVFLLEQVIKYKLAEVNLLLIYDKLPDIGVLKAVLDLGAVKDMHTVQITKALILYKVLFPDSKITKNSKEIELLLEYRNELQHQIVPFKEVSDDNLLQLVRGAYSDLKDSLESIVGRLPAVRQSTLSTERVADLFKESVRKKLFNRTTSFRSVTSPGFSRMASLPVEGAFVNTSTGFGWSIGSVCPACGLLTFRKQSPYIMILEPEEDLNGNYACSICGLELSSEEYEVAKELIKRE